MKERTGNWKYQAIELTEACCETIATILNNSIIEKTAVNSRTIRHSHHKLQIKLVPCGH
jgi:hypothetical protein